MAEPRSACPLNATLEVLGDRWSLLIVRDLIFKGRTTYGNVAGANLLDWPVTLAEMDPWYDKAEGFIGVTGTPIAVDAPER